MIFTNLKFLKTLEVLEICGYLFGISEIQEIFFGILEFKIFFNYGILEISVFIRIINVSGIVEILLPLKEFLKFRNF